MDALTVDRIHFAFTITFHYLFPQLTMGLSLLIVILKTLALRTGDPHYDEAARFWARIFGINFVVGVVTGIPMEFQFGTNWSAFSKATGGVIGQPLAMEGVFSFFLESTFLGALLFGERQLGPRLHWLSAFLVFLGSWISGFFIIASNAWMQHPVGYARNTDGTFSLISLAALLTNRWAVWEYSHNMTAAVVTGSTVMAAMGAFYLLMHQFENFGRTFVRLGVVVGLVASALMIFPTGDRQGYNVTVYQPVTLAAMEGLFEKERGAPLAIIGQPDVEARRLDNPIIVPNMLSFLTHRRWKAEVQGLVDFPQDQWPDNVALLYYAYHIMVGLGTIFVATFALAGLLIYFGRLYQTPLMLWALMLMAPFPYIATMAGWMTAELGRQPWLVYGLMRTAAGGSPKVSAGSGLFTLLGFMGLYAVLGVLFLFLLYLEVQRGPARTEPDSAEATTTATDDARESS